MTRLQVTGVKGISALITGFGLYMLNLVNAATLVLIMVMAADMILGLGRSYVTKSWNSTVGLAGIFKKFVVLLLVTVTAMIEYLLMSIGQTADGYILLVVTSFFIVNEVLSILENAAQIGVPIPPMLYNALEKLHRDPVGKEQRVVRDPLLDRMDKIKLIEENQQLQQEIVQTKAKEKETV